MNQPKRDGISRRQFARRAALLSATASIVPAASVFADSLPVAPALQTPDTHPHLSSESQTEAEARYQQILGQYGGRFSAEDKTTIRQANLTMQSSLEKIRANALENGDSPALYLKPLVEREKKKTATPIIAPAKKS